MAATTSMTGQQTPSVSGLQPIRKRTRMLKPDVHRKVVSLSKITVRKFMYENKPYSLSHITILE